MIESNKTNHYNYNCKLQPFANQLRKTMTKSEACLWKYMLKAKRTGYGFNRQRPILNYIADFHCKELLLIIEADGYSHQNEEAFFNDLERQRKLESVGYKVIRFTDTEILKQIESVQRAIEIAIQEREIELGIKPPPAPSERGV